MKIVKGEGQTRQSKKVCVCLIVCLFVVCLYVPLKLVLHNVECYETSRQISTSKRFTSRITS
jgi:hypothetical protein